ncbi:MAG: zinc-ribbon domain-containing protein [Pyrinomonadaceae bacterium]|nr:zinc-ribbon domain-containing protein [Chloracidobacterium sp.]
MFCPKCGQQNPETGKFCRSCGTDLGNVSQALSSPAPSAPQRLVNHKGKPISYESAMTKIFTGVAFLAVSIALSFSIGRGWWFWMLIPAFTSLGAGIAQYLQIRRVERGGTVYNPGAETPQVSGGQNTSLPAAQTEWVAPESRYKTGDLVPPSVTDGTTRHLEMDSEGKTMTLPKK